MYMDIVIPIPKATGKISRQKTRSGTYIHYIVDRVYDPKKKHTAPKRVIIGRLTEDGENMIPNERFLTYFPNTPLPERRAQANRSATLSVGPYVVFDRIIKDYKLNELTEKHFGLKSGLLLDLACYMIQEAQNQAQHYPNYAFRRPLFTENMQIMSDATISRFLSNISDEQIVGFLKDWNANREHQERIYISYDSTNKNTQAGDIDFAELGNAKDDKATPIVNIGVAYDSTNQVPLFYEVYPGSINDVSQFRYFVDKALAYEYRNVGFVLDRGYFSRANIEYMDEHKLPFVMMVKGCKPLVSELIDKHRGSFEDSYSNTIRPLGISGMTVRRGLFSGDDQERYFHLYFSPQKKIAERAKIDKTIREMERVIEASKGRVMDFGKPYTDLFEIHVDKKNRLLFAELRTEIVDRQYARCGYFCIVTSEEMTSREAYTLYRSRDGSEKIFSSDKTFLGSASLRVHSSEAMSGKMFVEFVALIIRQRLYSLLKNEMMSLPVRKSFLTVPAALGELDKIEATRFNDKCYQLCHAVTKTQATILRACGLKKEDVSESVARISEILSKAPKKTPQDQTEEMDEDEDMAEDSFE